LCEPGAASNTAGSLLSGERRWGDGLHHHLGVSAFADHIDKQWRLRRDAGV